MEHCTAVGLGFTAFVVATRGAAVGVTQFHQRNHRNFRILDSNHYGS